MGDETGLVTALLPTAMDFIKEGVSIKIDGIDAEVIDSHILMKGNKKTEYQKSRHVFNIILSNNNISNQEWVE